MDTPDTDYHFDMVKKWTNSSSSNKRQKANESLEILIENDCTDELKWIVDNWTNSSSSNKRKAADKAFKALS